MKYTKEQLQGFSDFEVNRVLGHLVYKNSYIERSIHGGDEVSITNKDFALVMVDYCNNWNDVMPLAVEHGISLKRSRCPAGSGYAYYAESYGGEHHTDYMIPQRAIACCLILVLQENKK